MKDNRLSSRKLISFSQFLYENSSKTIQNLADEFGSENMYSRMMDFTFDDDSLKRMFKTLDRSLFDSKIVDIYMQISGADDIGKFVRATSEDDLKSYDFYALYFTAFDFIYNKTTEIDDLSTIEDQAFSYDKVKIRYFQRRLFVNSDMLHDSNMIFAANCICHEMIHMFDQKFGEGEDAMMKSSRLQIDINTHSTPTFMKMKKKAMRDKMKIIDDG